MKPIPGSVAFLLVIAGFFGLWGSLGATELININTASLEQLDTLPDVGPTRAQAIIDGRPYASIEEISKMDWIGEPGSPSYEKIKNLITVGAVSQTQSQTQHDEDAGEDTQTQESADSSGSSANRPKPPSSVSAVIYAPRHAIAGAEVWFEAEAKNGSTKLSSAKFEWSFGDGASVRGAQATHRYAYPGKYAVVVTASQGGVEGTARHTVEVLPLQLALLAEADGSLSIVSSSKYDTDLSYWSVAAGEDTFTFPPGTMVLAGETLRLSPAVTGIPHSAGTVLFFSNGTVAAAAQPRSAVLASSAQPTAPATRSASSAEENQVLGVAEESQAAAAAAGEPVALPASWYYFLALVALLLIGSAAVFYLQQAPAVAADSPADEFEIIETKRG